MYRLVAVIYMSVPIPHMPFYDCVYLLCKDPEICELFPKHLKLTPTLRAPLLINLYHPNSKNPPYPCNKVGKR